MATHGNGAIALDAAQRHAGGGDPAGPTIVVPQAGNVNTGACDDLAAIWRPRTSHGAWVHVDGAFGLWAAAARPPVTW